MGKEAGGQSVFVTVSCLTDDGLIDESDLREVMKACMVENGMQFDEKEVASLANALFEDAVQVSSARHQLITKFCRHQTLLAAAANILCLVFLVFQETTTIIIITIVFQDTITIIIIIVLQDGCAGITVDDLKDQLTRHEGLLENLTISIGKWLVPPRPTAARKSWCQMLRFG